MEYKYTIFQFAKEDTAIMLVGNKSDLEKSRQVSKETAQEV